MFLALALTVSMRWIRICHQSHNFTGKTAAGSEFRPKFGGS